MYEWSKDIIDIFTIIPNTLFELWDFIPPSHPQPLFASVWHINLTLYSFSKAIYNLQHWSESLLKRKRRKKKHHSWRSINFAALHDVQTGYFQLFLVTEVQAGGTGFYLPIALPPVIPNGPATEDVRHVNRRMKWALGWLSVDYHGLSHSSTISHRQVCSTRI